MIETAARLSSIGDLLTALDSVYAAFRHQPWWRGQARDWHLVPTVHRLRGRGPVYEANIAIKFAQRAPTRHHRCPERGDLASWLFLMQHYRLPTRLLDWTESPMAALFFAVEELEHVAQTGVLWALDPFLMNELVSGQYGIFQPGHPVAKNLIELAFSHTVVREDRVAALFTDEVDLRMLVQISAMTIHGSPTPLNEHPEAQRFLLKFEIEPAVKEELLRSLKRLGIRRRNLFPDLENLAEDLKDDAYPTPGTPEEPTP